MRKSVCDVFIWFSCSRLSEARLAVIHANAENEHQLEALREEMKVRMSLCDEAQPQSK